MQIVLIGSFLIAMIFDNWTLVSFGYPSILDRISHLPELLMPTVFLLAVGIYLVQKSHSAVFGRAGTPELLDSGVYSLVRHPMYLGGLMILLGFLFLNLSIIALVIWAVYAFLCDWMATYEEKDLLRVLGDKYANYQSDVPKWLMFSSRLRRVRK
jgi:protein-S-isoprenylcysteine O-methyltransferase Ste14